MRQKYHRVVPNRLTYGVLRICFAGSVCTTSCTPSSVTGQMWRRIKTSQNTNTGLGRLLFWRDSIMLIQLGIICDTEDID